MEQSQVKQLFFYEIMKVLSSLFYSFWTACCIPIHAVNGYYTVRPSTAITHKELLGVWRLTSSVSLLRKAFVDVGVEYNDDYLIHEQKYGIHNVMKEFTVQKQRQTISRPDDDGNEKDDASDDKISCRSRNRNASLLIRLKDDESFEIIVDGNDSSAHMTVYEKHLGLDQFAEVSAADKNRNRSFKEYEKGGRWHFEDGRIVLAPFISKVDENSQVLVQYQRENDMLLLGKVLCCSHENTYSLEQQKQQKDDEVVPMQFSIPYGNVETGRYMYPMNHRSFFDMHPIFKPEDVGHFQMQKILSETPESDEVEKYTVDDLAGKRFFITAEPLKKKKKERWSRSLGKMVGKFLCIAVKYLLFLFQNSNKQLYCRNNKQK